MLNFNNKKVKENFPVKDENQDPDITDRQYYISNLSKERRQETPTQCLLFISEMQNSEKQNQNYRYPEIQSVQVTPWVNMPFRIKKQGNQSKSKTSTLLSSCDDYRNLAIAQKRQKQNRISFTKKQSRKHIRLLHKNTDSIKNIQSAIASYSERTNEQLSQGNGESNKNLKVNVLQLKTNNSTHQVSKISVTKGRNRESKGKNLRYCNNQNANDSEIGHLSILEMEKFQENLKGMKNFMNSTSGYKSSTTHSILRQNTAIVNDAKAVSLFSCVEPEIKEEKTKQLSTQNLQALEKQSQVRKKTQQSTKQRELSIFRKAQFENILTDAQKKTSQYHKIKAKILESIKKEAVVRQGTKMDINKSKKMLGRYYKQIQQKKPKNKLKTHLTFTSNIQKTESSDAGYQYTNPLTKQLYDKYKLVLNKGK